MFTRASVDRGANNVQAAGPGNCVLDQTQAFPITTVGTGVLSAAGILSGIIERTGPTGAYADTLETADNLLAAAPELSAGDSFEFLVRNTVAFANTVAVAEGAELSGSNTAIAASSVRKYLLTILSNGRRSISSANTTNSSATVTGLSQAQAQAITPGMGVTGTGIPAATTVLSVNSATGTVVLSANATATGTAALTFFPRYNVKGLFTASL